ncbi:gene transfer agent family protein [Microvirga arabica]|uniref:Gene transfer agent family protein n=1 Tax=Microvirga arabica TaxID=1128671 RepID=A0ABV6Y4S1_9HYPH|nr:gene transfer agent family protein [Microvirga arabica]MBM1170904.1 gene transfer agent family protein [Microvirga arabica]
MPNRRRGEMALQLGDTRYTLCLALGALAELEDPFGVQDLMALSERFGTGRLSSRDLLTLLAVALRGGGQPLSDAEVANLPLHDGVEPVAEALANLLVMTFGGGETSPNPPSSQETSASQVPSPWTMRLRSD